MGKANPRLAMLLMAAVFLLVGSSSEGASPLPPAETDQTKPTAQLREEVDKLLAARDPVMIRRNIKEVFTLIDRFVETKNDREAFDYLGAALQHDSWALGYQMLYAEMLLKRGEAGLARKKAALVLEFAEKDSLVDRAMGLLQDQPLPPIPSLSGIDDPGTSLVLMALGKIDTCVLTDLSKALRQKLPVPVHLCRTDLPIPLFRRDPFQIRLHAVRSKILEGMEKDREFAAFMQTNGIGKAELEKDAVVIDAVRRLAYASGGKDALRNVDKSWKQIAEAEKQWEISDLLNMVRSAAGPYRRDKVYFLGVANLDAFADKSNFIFGIAENNAPHAVITYRRFAADFNTENPNRKRLVERTLKQSLSSIGFMLGVSRCSTPTCARAYPNNLAEHDAKSTELCDVCKDGFERSLGMKLK